MRKLLWLQAMAAALLLSAVPVLADDGFYVVGGRPTPGTRITSLPCTITTPGYYYLTQNFSFSGSTAITVNCNDVTIDLMGFVLSGTTAGISLNGNNVEVRNGTITGWIYALFGSGINQRAIGVRAVGNYNGILLGRNSLIQGCTATPGIDNTGWALKVTGGTIDGCTVMNFAPADTPYGVLYTGDAGGTISNNVVIDCSGGEAIKGCGPTTISNNFVKNCLTAISNDGGGSIVGNVVEANSGQTGIAPATGGSSPNFISTFLDQNSVKGAGTHYGPGNAATFYGLNSP